MEVVLFCLVDVVVLSFSAVVCIALLFILLPLSVFCVLKSSALHIHFWIVCVNRIVKLLLKMKE